MINAQIKHEFELVEALHKKFVSESHKVLTEVQLFERYIDLIAIDENNKLYAIEAKISSTTQAFKQAERYKIIADSVYVATKKNSSNNRALELSAKTGIGLILIEKDLTGNYIIEIAKYPTHDKIKNNSITNYVLGLTTEYAK